jgi:hypothetical protein
MNQYAFKNKEIKNQAAANSTVESKGENKLTFQFVDNRQEAIQMRKIQELANNSQHVRQLKAFQEMSNNKPQVVQRMVPQRAILGKKLIEGIFSSKNPLARAVFKGMNHAMYREGQPLAEAHQKVLEESLLHKQNGILDTLIAENPHVMNTQGSTPIYLLGKNLVHRPLEWYLSNSR